MRKKNLFLLLLAMVLVCAISVTGTMAYLTDKANDGTGVTNTFIASGSGELIEDPDTDDEEVNATFKLVEYKVEATEAGVYAFATENEEKVEVISNSYNVLPGVDLPKQPFVYISKKTDAPAYLYVEVVDGLTDSGLTYSMDATSWMELKDAESNGVTGPNGGKVYVYTTDKNNAAVLTSAFGTDGTGSVDLLTDDKIIVGDTVTIESTDGIKLEFYAYLAQSVVTSEGASSSDAVIVFNTCFNTTSSNT